MEGLLQVFKDPELVSIIAKKLPTKSIANLACVCFGLSCYLRNCLQRRKPPSRDSQFVKRVGRSEGREEVIFYYKRQKKREEDIDPLCNIMLHKPVATNIMDMISFEDVENLLYVSKKMNRMMLVKVWLYLQEKKQAAEKLSAIFQSEEVAESIMKRIPIETVANLRVLCQDMGENTALQNYLQKYQEDCERKARVLELIHLILSNLPAKVLQTFKCVSKHWNALISTSSFVELHFLRAKVRPQLLIASGSHNVMNIFSPKDGFSGGEATTFTKKIDWDECELLHPLNGLLCLFHPVNYSTRIYNMGTGKKTSYIPSSLPVQPKGTILLPSVGFGFDPVTGQHKVLCIWEIYREFVANYHDEGIKYKCEVLTVGERQWRVLDKVPQLELCREPVYANGSIYRRREGDDLILAFDVGTETFRVIEVPESCGQEANLVQVDGLIALVKQESNRCLQLWISDDDCREEKPTVWKDEKIALPFDLENDYHLYISGIEGTDKLIIENPIPTDPKFKRDPRDCMYLWLYNRVEKSFLKVSISGISPPLTSPYIFGMFVCHDSLLPIEDAEDAEDAPAV